MNDSIIIIGLTGQSGAGKTTVCKVFEENGFTVINADHIAKEVLSNGTKCLEEVYEAFSHYDIQKDGKLDRNALANIVFSDKGKLNLLNGITYPYITEQILIDIERLSKEGKRLILLDAPTLFESRADDFCDLIISVIAEKSTCLERIIVRDNISQELAVKRLNSQQSDEFYTDNSDFIIKNNKDIDMLIEKAKEVSDKIKEYYDTKNN